MWTFDNFPSARVKQLLYGFGPDQKWLDRVRKASVRLEGGCSGSIVSKDGLVLTNHHCVADCESDLSSPGNDYHQDGFFAPTRKDEKICPGAEASILQAMSDVTARVSAAGEGAASEAAGARSSEIAAIESQACGENRLKRCEVVNLYRGGQYMLYIYDRYDDVRIAFAPEMQAAFFGGDPDNFNFPRYALDMALLRLYRDGKPVTFTDPSSSIPTGAKDGDLSSCRAIQGSTERLLTNAQLEFQRDHFPALADRVPRRRSAADARTATKGEEERAGERCAAGRRKLAEGVQGAARCAGRADFLRRESGRGEEAARCALAEPELRAKYGDPFADVEALVATQRQTYLPYQMLEVRFRAGSVILADARATARRAAELREVRGRSAARVLALRIQPVDQRALRPEVPVHPLLESSRSRLARREDPRNPRPGSSGREDAVRIADVAGHRCR